MNKTYADCLKLKSAVVMNNYQNPEAQLRRVKSKRAGLRRSWLSNGMFLFLPRDCHMSCSCCFRARLSWKRQELCRQANPKSKGLDSVWVSISEDAALLPAIAPEVWRQLRCAVLPWRGQKRIGKSWSVAVRRAKYSGSLPFYPNPY